MQVSCLGSVFVLSFHSQSLKRVGSVWFEMPEDRICLGLGWFVHDYVFLKAEHILAEYWTFEVSEPFESLQKIFIYYSIAIYITIYINDMN